MNYIATTRLVLLIAYCVATSAGALVQAQTRMPEVATVTEVADGIFVNKGVHELFTPANSGAISNASFVVGEDAVAVIDTGGSKLAGTALLKAIRQRTGLPVRYVINTHMHPDHVFGNAAFVGENATFVGHHKLARALAVRSEQYLRANADLLGASFEDTTIVLPQEGVESVREIDLGGRILVLEAHATSHTDNDLTVYDKRTSTLFAGDLLFAEHVPVVDGSIRGWLKTMQKLAARKIERVVPGHGPAAMSWPEALEPQKRYLETLVREIRSYIDQGRTLAEAARNIGQSERGSWVLFDDFNARSVSAAFAELEWE
jgi:quinoprotein relay system zinc metallohydrolase 2